MHRRTPRFCAIIGHADDAEILRACIAHHLAIGVADIFVSINVDDGASDAVVREFAGTQHVRGARVETFARDPFAYFSEALEVVRSWCAPDWVFFVDSDEFWLARSGRIDDLPGLNEVDQLAVARYNAPPIRGQDGAMFGLERFVPGTAAIADATEFASTNALADPALRWVIARDHPKMLVRPEIVAEVGRGAHAIVPATPHVRGRTSSDLLIVHLPFTTRERFERKVRLIRRRLDAFGDRFGEGQAWHWRRWIAIDDAGEIGAEFDRQVVAGCDANLLRAAGRLTTAREIFSRTAAPCG